MVKISNNTKGNVNITTKNGLGVNLTSNNDTDVNANMNGNAQRAKSWAVGEGLIDGVDYSAKHYAQDAKESAEQASGGVEAITEAKEQALSAIDTEKTEAIADMETAKEEKISEIEQTAAGFEDDLEALTTRAETAATNAETSETNAATSATSAENSSIRARNFATDAGNYVADAEYAKDVAVQAKENAQTAKTAAENAQARAEMSASNARDYEQSAYNNANAASNSATRAAQEASMAATARDVAEIARDAAEGYAQEAEQAKDDIEAELDNYVPNTRKVNNKPLSTDITLTSSDIGALANTTKYGYSVALSLDTTNYKLTLTLKDQDGTALSTKTVDFPIESVVVNGSYDSTNQKIVLTLQSGSTIDIPVGDLISGLQSEITSTNKLDSDLVDDTNSSHKFATAAQLSQIATNTSSISNLATVATSGDYDDLTNKPTIPTDTNDLTNGAGYITGITSTDVTSALGYTPYNSTNPNGYTSNIGTVTKVNNTSPDSSGNVSITIPTVPTNISAFTNDSGYITSSALSPYALSSSLATVATSGSYNDLSNKPTIPDAQVQADWDVTDTTSKAYIKNKPYIPSGVVVDQTYDGTSANAQSGVAINGAGFLKNTATATNSLTILGTTNNQNNSILIGYSTTTSSTNSTVIGNTAVSGGSYATALGYYARANGQYTTAIGNSSYANYQDVTAVGHSSQATAAGTLAVGSNSKATAQRATSIGYSSQATQYQATALGYEAKATANSALQIGTGTNSTANTLQVGSYTLLNTSTGLIPDARISSNIARTSDLSGYVQASNGNMTFANAGTEGDILYTDSTTGEFYGVVIGQSSTYGTGVTIGAGNSLAQNGYMLNLSLNGLGLIDASNMGTALLTVSNNNLAVNGSEVVTGDNTRFDGQWVQSFLDLVTSAITLNDNYSNAWDISSYLPNDNHIYEVYVSAFGITTTTSGSLLDVRVGSSILKANNTTNSATAFVLRSSVRSNANRQVSNTIVIPVGTDRQLTVRSFGTGTLNTLRLLAYRRVGTNT